MHANKYHAVVLTNIMLTCFDGPYSSSTGDQLLGDDLPCDSAIERSSVILTKKLICMVVVPTRPRNYSFGSSKAISLWTKQVSTRD